MKKEPITKEMIETLKLRQESKYSMPKKCLLNMMAKNGFDNIPVLNIGEYPYVSVDYQA